MRILIASSRQLPLRRTRSGPRTVVLAGMGALAGHRWAMTRSSRRRTSPSTIRTGCRSYRTGPACSAFSGPPGESGLRSWPRTMPPRLGHRCRRRSNHGFLSAARGVFPLGFCGQPVPVRVKVTLHVPAASAVAGSQPLHLTEPVAVGRRIIPGHVDDR